jgi:tetratricopeptide (TPR) repeat protein
MDLLRLNQYKHALGHFQAAVKVAPKDSRGWMMLGMTFNRLGLFGNASVALQKSKALGMKAPHLDFELGWAAFSVGSFKAATKHLEAYENIRTGRAKTSAFLGRAYPRLKQFDKAEKILKQAIKRDPKVKPSVRLYLSRIYAARNDQKAASGELNQIIAQSPNSPVGKLLRDRLTRIDLAKKRKPWFVSLAVSGGHNDNVIGLPEAAVLPADISSRASNFARNALNAGYAWRLSDISQVNVGYGLTADTYADVDGFEFFRHCRLPSQSTIWPLIIGRRSCH